MDHDQNSCEESRWDVHSHAKTGEKRLLESAHVQRTTLWTNPQVISATIKRRRLTLAGHVSRHNEPAGSLIFWSPEEPRRRGRPNTTLKDVLKSDTGLSNDEMRAVMADRLIWKRNFIMSPN